MKVCILSMQRVPNMGSLLQSYALKTILERQGHSVSFLNIEPNLEENALLGGARNLFFQEGEKTGVLGKLKKLDRYWLNRLKIKVRAGHQNRVFEAFRTQELGTGVSTEQMRFDCCVIGSDEVFNCLSGAPWGFTSQLFGNVRQADRVITYAASCGSTVYEDVPQAARERIREAFAKVSAFSVRDRNTAAFVRQLTNTPVLEHLDPVLVGDFEKEIHETKLPDELPEHYCVIYSYYNRFHDQEEIRQILRFCEAHNMEPVAVGAPQMWIRNYPVLTPFETLKVFQNAAFVITDTFHGTIFSAKFARRFATMVRPSNANKLRDLIGRLGLEDHVVSSLEQLESAYSRENDILRIDAICKAERKRTIHYLTESLRGNE